MMETNLSWKSMTEKRSVIFQEHAAFQRSGLLENLASRWQCDATDHRGFHSGSDSFLGADYNEEKTANISVPHSHKGVYLEWPKKVSWEEPCNCVLNGRPVGINCQVLKWLDFVQKEKSNSNEFFSSSWSFLVHFSFTAERGNVSIHFFMSISGYFLLLIHYFAEGFFLLHYIHLTATYYILVTLDQMYCHIHNNTQYNLLWNSGYLASAQVQQTDKIKMNLPIQYKII